MEVIEYTQAHLYICPIILIPMKSLIYSALFRSNRFHSLDSVRIDCASNKAMIRVHPIAEWWVLKLCISRSDHTSCKKISLSYHDTGPGYSMPSPASSPKHVGVKKTSNPKFFHLRTQSLFLYWWSQYSYIRTWNGSIDHQHYNLANQLVNNKHILLVLIDIFNSHMILHLLLRFSIEGDTKM